MVAAFHGAGIRVFLDVVTHGVTFAASGSPNRSTTGPNPFIASNPAFFYHTSYPDGRAVRQRRWGSVCSPLLSFCNKRAAVGVNRARALSVPPPPPSTAHQRASFARTPKPPPPRPSNPSNPPKGHRDACRPKSMCCRSPAHAVVTPGGKVADGGLRLRQPGLPRVVDRGVVALRARLRHRWLPARRPERYNCKGFDIVLHRISRISRGSLPCTNPHAACGVLLLVATSCGMPIGACDPML